MAKVIGGSCIVQNVEMENEKHWKEICGNSKDLKLQKEKDEANGCTNAIDVAMNGTAKTRNLTPVQTKNVAVNIGTNPVSDPNLKNPNL